MLWHSFLLNSVNSQLPRWGQRRKPKEIPVGDKMIYPLQKKGILIEVSFTLKCKATVILLKHNSSNSKETAVFAVPDRITATDHHQDIHLLLPAHLQLSPQLFPLHPWGPGKEEQPPVLGTAHPRLPQLSPLQLHLHLTHVLAAAYSLLLHGSCHTGSSVLQCI